MNKTVVNSTDEATMAPIQGATQEISTDLVQKSPGAFALDTFGG